MLKTVDLISLNADNSHCRWLHFQKMENSPLTSASNTDALSVEFSTRVRPKSDEESCCFFLKFVWKKQNWQHNFEKKFKNFAKKREISRLESLDTWETSEVHPQPEPYLQSNSYWFEFLQEKMKKLPSLSSFFSWNARKRGILDSNHPCVADSKVNFAKQTQREARTDQNKQTRFRSG